MRAELSLLFAFCTSPLVAACDLSAPEPGVLLADGRVEVLVTENPAVACYLLTLADGSFALVDTGAAADGSSITDALARHGSTRDDVSAIFLTHGHGDHTAAVRLFDGARVFAMETELPLIEGREGPERPLPSVGAPEETGIVVTDPLLDDTLVEIAGSVIEAFAIPGHTDGSAAYLYAGVLFVGDAALGTTDRELVNTPWVFSTDQAENLSSLERLVEVLDVRDDEVTTIAPSHSAPLDEGLAPLRAMLERGGTL
jgi:glyoxylase-like metal-dependent hydrolase (beta-lactamase superfamily II)